MNNSEYQQICREVARAGARLVAVSKTHSVDRIRALYDLGQRDFGENRVGELLEKIDRLPDDIQWHFIGHLQRNKVRDLVGKVALIHSGDSLRLLREIDKRAAPVDVVQNVLLQFHIAEEDSKYGLTRESATELMASISEEPLTNVSIQGVMGMATYTDDEEQLRLEFTRLHGLFAWLKEEYFADQPDFVEISMGMSNDYALALESGSTIVRLGSLIFGERE